VASLVRLSGWSCDYILWMLPYSTGLQLLHAESIYNNNAVEYVIARTANPDTGLAAQFDKMRSKD
jgi:hypothetical protein